MKKGMTINIGNFQNIYIESSERETVEECNADLLALINDYETRSGLTIEQIQKYIENHEGRAFVVRAKRTVTGL